MIKYSILFLILSAMFRSIEQIRFFRPDRTWLPKWVYYSGSRINLDGYHIASGLNIWCMFFTGFFFFSSGASLWWVPVLWFAHGNTFSLFYHVIFMKPEYRENFVLRWFKRLFNKD